MSVTVAAAELRPAEFESIRDLLYQVSGIRMHDGKIGLVRTRLTRRLTSLGIASFADYLRCVESDATEMAMMLDLLTTNKTSFFREPQHFAFLRGQLMPELAGRSRLRIWSAGCSSGEEPYTLAMLLREEWPDFDRRDVRILATDLSGRVLARAREGMYSDAVVRDVPAALLRRFFTRQPDGYRIADPVRAPVRFARLNLMEPWPMKGPFDVIFCRNVMIYFDRPTQERLVNRFWQLLSPGGHLFVGHSESLTSLAHRFRYVQPAVYVR